MTAAKAQQRHRHVVAFLVRGHAQKPAELLDWIQTGNGLPGNVSGRASLNDFAQALADAEAAGRQGAEWTRIGPDSLPDSDAYVALIHEAHGWPSFALGLLEFTDDSEGHGRPYWETTRGQGELSEATHYLLLPAIPSKPGDPT